MSFFSRKAPTPQPTRCHACGATGAEAVCHCCATERPAYTALKNITAKAKAARPVPTYPPCRYAPASLCGCGERGICLEAV